MRHFPFALSDPLAPFNYTLYQQKTSTVDTLAFFEILFFLTFHSTLQSRDSISFCVNTS